MRTGYASSPSACDYLGAIHQGLHLFFFPLCFTPPLKQNGYSCAWDPGGLDFENSTDRGRTVSLWVQDSAGISLTFEKGPGQGALISGFKAKILAQLDKVDILTVHFLRIRTIAFPSCDSVGHSLPFVSRRFSEPCEFAPQI
jgi:hypothetical protein